MKKLDEVLAEHPFFAGLADAHRTIVSGCGEIAVYNQPAMIRSMGRRVESSRPLERRACGRRRRSP